MTSAPGLPRDGKDHALLAVLAGTGLVGVLWLAGVTSARVSGQRTPHADAFAPLRAFRHLGDPSLAWNAPVGRGCSVLGSDRRVRRGLRRGGVG